VSVAGSGFCVNRVLLGDADILRDGVKWVAYARLPEASGQPPPFGVILEFIRPERVHNGRLWRLDAERDDFYALRLIEGQKQLFLVQDGCVEWFDDYVDFLIRLAEREARAALGGRREDYRMPSSIAREDRPGAGAHLQRRY